MTFPFSGPHCIQASIADIEIPGSPFGCEVYDINQVEVGNFQKGLVGKPYEFDSMFNLFVLQKYGHF